MGNGLTYLAVEGDASQLAERVNAVKTAVRGQPGGAFYVNEYRHVIVPVGGNAASGADARYYYAGRLETDLNFEFEGRPLSTRPVHPNGRPLQPGERWIGPRPGIPYVLAAGAADIHYVTQALNPGPEPAVMPGVTQKVQLSKVLRNAEITARAVAPIKAIRGHQGGRFYVNEHQAIFTPVGAGDGNGLEYVYCGQLDMQAWFPEPRVGDD